MPKFRKKPVVIEAEKITREMTVVTHSGTMKGQPGNWLITGVRGEKYFCTDDIFRETYEVCEDDVVSTTLSSSRGMMRPAAWENPETPK